MLFSSSYAWWTAAERPKAIDYPIAQANQRPYETVDWAMDISEARFTGIEMSRCDIPARLIRRDPATQVVVTRESVSNGDWATASTDSGGWQIAIEDFLASGVPDTVLVACKRGRFFKGQLAAIKRLRDMEVALPD